MPVSAGSGALVPASGEGSTAVRGWVGAAADGAGMVEAAALGVGTAGPGEEESGKDEAGVGISDADPVTDGVFGAEGLDATGAALGEAAGELTETVGKGAALPGAAPAGPPGAVVQPATPRLKKRQAAVIAVVLFSPRPACMTAPRSCPPVSPTLGRVDGTQHAATVTVRIRVGHAGPSKQQERECPRPAQSGTGAHKAKD
ncbi:hypothetical protein [Paenarthrobacter sp. 4246]|uniref:hypothetical protein n=1 Tax=Paenarthrobacter sp. 4246 TaxID=3156456 RepID=UPI00339B003A